MSDSCQVSQSQDQDLRGQQEGEETTADHTQLGFPADVPLPCTETEARSPGRGPPHGHWEHEEYRDKGETRCWLRIQAAWR